MSFSPRKIAPSSTNKYYIPINKGGYNKYSEQSYISYAYGRFMEEAQLTSCNLPIYDWYNKATLYPRGNTPKVGAVACWSEDVAIVEEVYADDSILISHGGTRFFLSTLKKPYNEGQEFLGFIYNPALTAKDNVISVKDTSNLNGYTNAQLVEMVLAGKFGNGAKRRAALGDRYAAVQALVDQKLSASTFVVKPVHRSNEVIAQEVLDGKWGEGEDRRKRLTAAGYNYYSIQTIVKNLAARQNKALKVGAKCYIKPGAKDLNTMRLYSSFVYKNTYVVESINDNRVTFGNSQGTTGVTDKSNIIIAKEETIC